MNDALRDKYEKVLLMVKCLFFKIRPNVRTIYMEYEQEPRAVKLHVFLDTDPVEQDYELMEDAKMLFISFDDLYLIDFDIFIERSDDRYDRIYASDKLPSPTMHMLYGRYET